MKTSRWSQESLLLLVMMGSSLFFGCKTVFLQTDGFPDKLNAGCKTEAECRSLVVEAMTRVDRCQENTIGYVRCDDARADLRVAKSFTDEYDRAEKQQKDEDEKRERNEASAIAAERAEKNRKEREDIRTAQQQEVDDAKAAKAAATARTEWEKAVHAGERVRPRVEICERTRDARAARARHRKIEQTAGFDVKSLCKPKIARERVVGYACPPSVDSEVAALGTYQLGVGSYPFPEDRALQESDTECEEANRLLQEGDKARNALKNAPK